MNLALGAYVLPAILTELSLRATQNSLATDCEKYAQTFLVANSDSPIYVPLGLRDSHLQFVDLGRNSVVSISGNNQTEQLSVLNALIISALFASSKKSNIMVYSQKTHQLADDIGVSTASSIAELIQSGGSERSIISLCKELNISERTIRRWKLFWKKIYVGSIWWRKIASIWMLSGQTLLQLWISMLGINKNLINSFQDLLKVSAKIWSEIKLFSGD